MRGAVGRFARVATSPIKGALSSLLAARDATSQYGGREIERGVRKGERHAHTHTHTHKHTHTHLFDTSSGSLPLKLASPCLTITFGTQLGTSLRFAERAGMNVLRDKPSTVVTSETPVAVSSLVSALKLLQEAPGALHVLRQDHAHADLVAVSFSGIGIGIPSVTTSVYLGYHD